ncbi:MAG: glycosyltransferase family 1 protein [Thermodesulfobacteriota bacterium]|nr:glycosyltransferase family 1 protein [Thermodesulfobacteriota bacterium]
MRIVIDIRTANDYFPGIGRYVINLSKAIAQIETEPSSCILIGNRKEFAKISGLKCLSHVQCNISPFSLRQQWKVPKLLYHLKAEVYHSPYYLMPYFPGIPTVVTFYDLIPIIYPEYFSLLKRLLFRIAIFIALKVAKTKIVISKATKRDIIHFFNIKSDSIKVIPLGVEAKFTPQPFKSIVALKKKYNLPDKYVLYLGINKPHKNLRRLIEAYSKLKEISPLVIAGVWDHRYPDAKLLSKTLHINDRVIFLGFVPETELPSLYSGAEIFIYPTLYEGFGLPVLEAMACGTPVICSNNSSLPEIVNDAAIMFNPLDKGDIVDKIAYLNTKSGLKEDLRGKGLLRAKKFSWERTAKETLKVYKELMKKDDYFVNSEKV